MSAQWRYVGSTSTGATTATWLDALFTLGTKATYYDGSTRTPGTGQAGTYSRYQNSGVTEAVYATPATDTLNVRHIWAGASSTPSPTPTMATPDVWANDRVFVSINKNSGAFNAYNAANPFTSGDFFGYWTAAWQTSLGAGTLYLYECERAAYVVVTIGTDTRHHCVGSFVDIGSVGPDDVRHAY